MSFASDKQAQLQAQYDAITEQVKGLTAQQETLQVQLQVLNEVVAQEQATTPATEAPVEQAADPNTGQPGQ